MRRVCVYVKVALVLIIHPFMNVYDVNNNRQVGFCAVFLHTVKRVTKQFIKLSLYNCDIVSNIKQ